jgi:hypothetical protein
MHALVMDGGTVPLLTQEASTTKDTKDFNPALITPREVK